jgi:hypothetical protein
MADQQGHKPDQGVQQQDDWKKNPNPNQGQQQGGQQKYPQSDRDKFEKDQQKKPA